MPTNRDGSLLGDRTRQFEMPALNVAPEIQSVLQDVVELGYVSVRNGQIVNSIPPRANVFNFRQRGDRWTPTITYVYNYAKHHKEWNGDYFVCIYDGWREYSPYVDENSRKYVPWRDLDKAEFLGVGIANEPRFRHRHKDTATYPEMPLKVLAYNRHLNDRNVLLLPDVEFIVTRFAPYVQQVKAGDIPWDQKLSKIVWRGSRLVLNGNVFYEYETASTRQRDAAVNSSAKPKLRDVVDASYSPTPIPWMLKYKYLLDIDGTVNAWSALYWKMSSNSLVWKLQSHWEQWYYNRLVANRHYIPLVDFSQTLDLYHWCEYDQQRCVSIVQQANQLISSLTYEFAISQYELR